MSSCLFCQIAAGERPATIVHRSGDVIAIRDINPQAPTHILIIPTKHIVSVAETTVEDEGLIGRLLTTAKEIAQQENLKGYRLVINTGAQAGQSVFHLHVHLLGGRAMHWPPG
ncbi:MAG TPA: histidine triad nucleotide-binding protein [Anaerolineae bacterium]|nr:histidine triad nucleotide-binding protein [Anaerolineae bacterium]